MSTDAKKTVVVSLQCSEGRFTLAEPVSVATTFKQLKALFKQQEVSLSDVNMNAFVVGHKGQIIDDASATLESANVQDQSVLHLLRRRLIPGLNRQTAEE